MDNDTLTPFPRFAISHTNRAKDWPHFLPELHFDVLLETGLAHHMTTAFHGEHLSRVMPFGTDQAVRHVWLRGTLPHDGSNGLLELLHLASLPEDDEEAEVPRTSRIAPRDVVKDGGTRGDLGVRGSDLIVEGLLQARGRSFQRGNLRCQLSPERGRPRGAEDHSGRIGPLESLQSQSVEDNVHIRGAA